ncbi:MAG: hypothetical protein R2910_02175 [Gemmatimonadales bacterium]
MPRWLRVLRGMVGTGLIFSVGVGVIASVIAGVAWLVTGMERNVELIRVVVASAMWAFPIGMAFAGFLALTARGRSFEKLTVPRIAALGAGGGLLLYGVLAANAWHAWSLPAALANLTIFVVLGSGSATAALLLARRAGPALKPGDDPPRLGEG